MVGANFGDEGKGLVTDYLCASQGAGMVVRYCGGANAGHTVRDPRGRRHVFSHFGSGTLAGVPTFLSQFFVCNPLLFFKELDALIDLGVNPVVYAHPSCLVTTFADIMINQHLELQRGPKRHGSCGVGFNETINRSQIPELKITLGDLWNWNVSLEARLLEICEKYTAFRIGGKIVGPILVEAFLRGCEKFAGCVHPLGIAQCPEPVFEGSQGLLLDMDNQEFFPHLTRSNTGLKNVRELCAQARIEKLETYYVSRTYLTRHGAGPLPGESAKLRYHDDTNVEHEYQGPLRFAPLDYEALLARCRLDAGTDNFKLALTHCDQHPPPPHSHDDVELFATGPTRSDVHGPALHEPTLVTRPLVSTDERLG